MIAQFIQFKIKSLNKMISVLEETEPLTEEDRIARESELSALRKQKEDIMDNPRIIGPTYSHINTKSTGKTVITKNSFRNNIRTPSPNAVLREQNVRALLKQQQSHPVPFQITYQPGTNSTTASPQKKNNKINNTTTNTENMQSQPSFLPPTLTLPSQPLNQQPLSSNSPYFPPSTTNNSNSVNFIHSNLATPTQQIETQSQQSSYSMPTTTGTTSTFSFHSVKPEPGTSAQIFTKAPPNWATSAGVVRPIQQSEFLPPSISSGEVSSRVTPVYSSLHQIKPPSGFAPPSQLNDSPSVPCRNFSTLEPTNDMKKQILLQSDLDIFPDEEKIKLPQANNRISSSHLPFPPQRITFQPSRSLSSPSQYALNRPNVINRPTTPNLKLPELNNLKENDTTVEDPSADAFIHHHGTRTSNFSSNIRIPTPNMNTI